MSIGVRPRPSGLPARALPAHVRRKPGRRAKSASNESGLHAGLVSATTEFELPYATEPSQAGLFAAIDMGSKSFRLEVAQLTAGRYHRIDALKETVRLGAGLNTEGWLVDEAAQRGLDCLSRFAHRIVGFTEGQVRVVATQTLREAANRDDFLLRAQAVLGRPIEIISGREEARLIYLGVARLQPSDARRLIVDIGGRSTEMLFGCGAEPLEAESFPVGSVSLSMKHFGDGRFTAAAFQAAQAAVATELEAALETFAPRDWDEALGALGTIAAVSQILLANGVGDGRIDPAGLRWLTERCLQAGSADRLRLPGLKDERRLIFGGGLAVLAGVVEHFRIDVLRPTKGALRQGVIVDLAARHAEAVGEALREASVSRLQQRFGVDVAQARRVETVALALLDGVRPYAGAEAHRELRCAAAPRRRTRPA